jgi:hypothetical protein
MRGGPSKQPTPATNKGGPPARTTPAANTTNSSPKNK